MRRWARWLVLGLPALGLAGAGVAIFAAPDPSYRLATWMALGRYASHDDTLRRVSAAARVDPLLLKAMAWKQSAFDAGKLGAEGRRGLLQISEAQGRAWAAAERVETFMFTDLFDADTNLRTGAWVLARATAFGKDFDSPEQYALVEFKAGRERAAEWGKGSSKTAELLRHADDETRGFVQAVMSRRDFYRANGW